MNETEGLTCVGESDEETVPLMEAWDSIFEVLG